MKRILVTGVTGHLGCRALDMLCPGNEVHALVRAIPASVRHGVSYHTVDLSAEWSTDTLPSRIDAVVHLAQSRRFREFPEQSVETFRINVASTATLLDYAWRAGATRFILASTGGLYSPAASVIGTPAQHWHRIRIQRSLARRSCSRPLSPRHSGHRPAV